MSDKKRIEKLEAMIVVLVKRIAKLEGKQRMWSDQSWLEELQKDAQKVADNLNDN